MAPYALEAWLRPLDLRVEPDGGVRLHCPNAFHRDRVRERFLPLIERHLAEELGRPVGVELVVLPPPPELKRRRPAETTAAPEPTPAPQTLPAGPSRPPHSLTPPRRDRDSQPTQAELPYRFENFVVGSCNALAREASLAIARGRQQGANPLYLAAPSGLGKTHLARAIARESGGGPGRVVYAPAETFTSDFTASVLGKRMPQFKRRYRFGCRLLVMEDVQFLESKSKTQLELFHTILHLLDAGARVVLTGDRLPRDLSLDPRLRSQMSSGLVAELEPPDARVRREILRAKAAAGGVHIPDACLELLVESLRGSVRDLEGVLIQLVASASLLKRRIDEELTRAALHKLQPLQAGPVLTPLEIVEAVAAFFRSTPEKLASRSRRRDVVWPRQLAMVLCTRYSDDSHAEIGRLFGRQHTAVRNAVRVAERAMLESAPRRYQVEALTERIEALLAERRRPRG